MSVDEDTELRDLVAQTLETNGVLNKIRAELRANVFLALEEQDALKKKTLSNKTLKSFLETKEGMLAFNAVYEFLEFFNLDFTLAVLKPESNVLKISPREKLINDFNMQTVDPKQPLLMELLKKKVDGKPTLSPPSSPKVSKIPQRVDKKPTTAVSDSKDKRVTSPELDDDNDLLKELGVSPINFNKPSENTAKSKPSWLTGDISTNSPPSASAKNDKENKPPPSSLGSLKGAPPLTGGGFNKKPLGEPAIDVLSPEWDELINIDKKINELGFEIPAEDSTHSSTKSHTNTFSNTRSNKSASGAAGVGGAAGKKSQQDEYNYDDDDFNSSVKSDENLSITEEIEENLSIGSFGGSKNEDLMTSDHTVSQISETGVDYAEDADFY